MKINEVEQLVGVTKRNIRYYEQEGLLSPGRDSSNGYRNYTDADVEILRQVKLFRKLDLPLEEIRRIQNGTLTVQDAMARHIIQLERKRTNLATMAALCRELESNHVSLSELDTGHYLQRVEQNEQEGTKFVNIKKKDTPNKYVGPVVVALVSIALMAYLIAFLCWAQTLEPIPLPLLIFFLCIPIVVIVGVLIALWKRIQQIKGGEEDDASQY